MSAADISLRAYVKIQAASLQALIQELRDVLAVIENGGTLALFQSFATIDDMLNSSLTNLTFAYTLNTEGSDGVRSMWLRTTDSRLATDVAEGGADVRESLAIPGVYFLRQYTRLPV